MYCDGLFAWLVLSDMVVAKLTDFLATKRKPIYQLIEIKSLFTTIARFVKISHLITTSETPKPFLTVIASVSVSSKEHFSKKVCHSAPTQFAF